MQHMGRPGGYTTPPPAPYARSPHYGGSLPESFFRPEPSLPPRRETHSDLYDVAQSLSRLQEGPPQLGVPGRGPARTPPLSTTTYRTMSYPPDPVPLSLPVTRALDPATEERMLGELQALLQRDPQLFLSALQGASEGGPTPQRGEAPRGAGGQRGSSPGAPPH